MKRITSIRSLLAVLAAAALAVPAFADASKIRGDVFRDQQLKKPPAGVALDAHRDAVRRMGLNGDDLEREEIAIYCDGPMSDVDLTVFRAAGIEIDPKLWIPPIPGQHPRGFYVARARYEALPLLAADPRVQKVTSIELRQEPQNDSDSFTGVDYVENTLGFHGEGVLVAVADSGLDLTHLDVPVPVEAIDVTDDDCQGCSLGSDVQNLVSNHGTHVTGSAVGRGTASLGVYAGSARAADLAFYKIGGDVSSGASVANQIQALDLATAAGADVFTMSYGGFGFFMDGSGEMEQAIDVAVAAGVTVFISAGNEATADEHYSTLLAPGATSASISITPTSPSSIILVTWIDDDPSSTNVTAVGGGLIDIASGVSARGTKSRRYDHAGTGSFSITLQNNGSGSSSTPRVHLYLVHATVAGADPSYTITSPADADGAIAVGAWVHRNSWTDCSGGSRTASPLELLYSVASFSSRGPRIDGVLKPDIVAPGARTISLLDSNWPMFTGNNAIAAGNQTRYSVLPCVYAVSQGTSMASPMAAGAAALIIEAYPFYTPEEVRAALTSTATTAGAPDTSWGYGLLQVDDAIEQPGGTRWVDFDFPLPFELGSYSFPFNTLAEGVSSVPAGGTILMRSSSSAETLTITKAMTLRAVDGPVTIGN